MTAAATQIAEKKVWASVVPGCDASPVLELGKEVLGLVPLGIEGFVVSENVALNRRHRGEKGDLKWWAPTPSHMC